MKTIRTIILVIGWLLAVSGCKTPYGHRPAPPPYDQVLSKAGIKYGIHGLRADGSFGIVLYELGTDRLSPLRGMPLTFVNAFVVKPTFDDLSPLKGMHLYCLYLPNRCAVADLAPLQGMPLEMLSLTGSQVVDLSPLQGMKLKSLDISGTQVEDLAPLCHTSIEHLSMGHTKVRDLSPLKDVANLRLLSLGPPSWLDAHALPIESPRYTELDLSPLNRVSLERLVFPVDTWTNGVEALRDHKTLRTINDMDPLDFWKAYDEGRFHRQWPGIRRPTSASTATNQSAPLRAAN